MHRLEQYKQSDPSLSDNEISISEAARDIIISHLNQQREIEKREVIREEVRHEVLKMLKNPSDLDELRKEILHVIKTEVKDQMSAILSGFQNDSGIEILSRNENTRI